MRKGLLLLLCFLLLVTGCMPPETKMREVPTEVPVTESPEAELKELLSSMTLKEKVAQMFIARCPEEGKREILSEYPLGGYIFFARDFKNSNPDKFREEAKAYQSISKIPMFLAVDEEGGKVTRVSQYKKFREQKFPSPQELYAAGGMEAVRQDAREKSEFLLSLGINLNFAPIADVSQNPNDYIYERTFGKSGEETAEYVGAVVEEMKKTRMGSVLKHFPGYGNNRDTHTGMAYDKRSYETFLSQDFLPFEAGMRAGAGMVLISHNIVECMDGELPASLSPEVHRILRKELEFDGIIITDDLAMDAIGLYTNDENAAVLAMKAGNDMICTTDFSAGIESIIRAVETGELSEDTIDQAVMRILRYKKELGIL